MNNYCKIYKLKQERIEEYKAVHGSGFPLWEAKAMHECGAEDMDIYLWENYCIITYQLSENWDQFIKNLSKSEVNQRWQNTVSSMFEETPVFDGNFEPLQNIFSLRNFI